MRYVYALVTLLSFTALGWYFYPRPEPPQQSLGSTGSESIRQEINITTAYLYAGSGSAATSSEIIAITDNNYTAPKYYFEVVASTTGATNATIDLVNATSSAVAATVTIDGGNTYARYRSTQFVPNASTTVEYKVRLDSEAIGKGIIAARVVVLQDTSDLTNTETQIEIGSATTTANNTTTLPLKDPKYWAYDSSKWDASPTFYVEATYKNTAVASSTIYSVSATTTATFYTYIGSAGVGYVVGEAWGGGGGGDGAAGSGSTIGGGGGGGGTYARATTTLAAGSTNRIGVGQGGAEGVARAVTASSTLTTASGLVLAAQGGEAAALAVGAATSTLAESVGGLVTAGGSGGDGQTDTDTGGGGGGSAGPDGYGISGKVAASGGPGGAGGAGDRALGGAGGAGGNGGDDTCDAELGGAGVNNVLGAGGGGGADGDVSSVCSGGNGGRPGGGGGGSDEGATGIGGPGQVKITEWIGTTGIAIEEDNGSFGSWTFKAQILVAGKTSTTSERVRSSSFTPTDGRHYRLVASTTNATASYDIYNAKIIVTSGVAAGEYLEDSYSESNSDAFTIMNGGTEALGQSFLSTGGTLASAKFYLKKTGSPTGNITSKIYAISNAYGGGNDASTGAALATSDAIDITTLSTTEALITFTFSGANQYAMSAGTAYIIDVEYTGTVGNQLEVGTDNSSPTHTGNACSFTSQGACTSASSGSDISFYLYGTFVAVPPTLLEPQYLLAPFKLPAGTSLTDFDTLFDTADWLTTNNYIHAVSAADNSTSVVTINNTTGDSLITGSTVTSPDNYATSTGMCLTSTATVAPKATTNNNDIYSSSIIVQVGTASTAVCGDAPASISPMRVNGEVNVNGIVNVRN